MQTTPRLAVGAFEANVDPQPMLWALSEVFERIGLHVQTFSSQARFASHDGAEVVSGQRRRHLDSWLMSAEVCRELFCRGARTSDLAIVEGPYDAARGDDPAGGSLDTLCQWLNLPKIAVLDARRLREDFGPAPPENLAGVLIDNVADGAEACRLQTTVETLWGVPVLGSLELLPAVRAVIGGLKRGCAPSRELCSVLGECLAPRLKLEQLCRIASSRPLPPGSSHLFDEVWLWPPLNVAVAYDEVFHYYFPDTLDLLEARGASLCDFSPLRDERLPRDTDLVYFGCGLPEYHAPALAANHCLKQSLRAYARAGGRIFAECGGLAYLCEQLETTDGRELPMAGVLPATARVNPLPAPQRPVEVTLSDDTWLGESGTAVRGYLNSNYTLEPTGNLRGLIHEPGRQFDIVGDGRVIASRVHVNFAAHARLLERFFHPLHQLAAVY